MANMGGGGLPPDRRVSGKPDDPNAPDENASKGALSASDPTDGPDVGEYLTIDGGDGDYVEETEDGGIIATLGGDAAESPPPDAQFYTNLATSLPSHILMGLSQDLRRKIEEDIEARKPRDKQYEEGLKKSGLGKDAGGAAFEGGSTVVHPMIDEMCVDYQSRIIKEVWPPSGPVKENLVGVPTVQKQERAKRVKEHMNQQLTMQMPEAKSVLETLLAQVPLGGEQYIRQYWDHKLMRPRWEFAPVDRVVIPYAAASFLSAERRTFIDKVTALEVRNRIDSGMYRDVGLSTAAQSPDKTNAEKANDKIEGIDDTGDNIDGQRIVYETMAYIECTDDMEEALDIEESGKLYPYLISIDEQGGEILAMYRDWEDGDDAREPIEHLFPFQFIPWRGALAIGIPQIVAGLSSAATGALRALLDSALVNNTFGGFILKGAGISAQTKRAEVGEFMEIEGGIETDDIRKKVMQFSNTQTSPVLFQLLEFLVESANGVIRSSLDETAMDTNANTPVGTQMSRVEEALVVFSAIHGRVHAAMNRLLAGLYRLNRLYLPDQVAVDAGDKELMVKRTDYQKSCEVQSVSDPTIYSDQQRYAQLNYIQSRAMTVPGLYNLREVELAGLQLIKWPDPERLLLAKAEPHELNAINENLAMTLGKSAVAFPEQDHLAHLQAHLDYLTSPVFGSSQLIAPKLLPLMMNHIIEHFVYYYAQSVVELVDKNLPPGMHTHELFSNDPAVKREMDQLLAVASKHVMPKVQENLANVVKLTDQAIAAIQQMAPKPPMDPATAALQMAQAETQRKAAADQATHQVAMGGLQIDQAKLQADQQQTQAQQYNDTAVAQNQAQTDQQKNAIMYTNAQLAAQTKIATTAQDNQTALTIAREKIESGAGTQLTDGGGMEGGGVP